jgi:hypothetical protein
LAFAWLISFLGRGSNFEGAWQEFANVTGNLCRVRFQRKVACINQMNLGFGKIFLESFGSLSGEDRIVLPLDDQGGKLVLAKRLLKRGIHFHVVAVVTKEVELNLVIAGSVQTRLVVAPRIGVSPVCWHALAVLEHGLST